MFKTRRHSDLRPGSLSRDSDPKSTKETEARRRPVLTSGSATGDKPFILPQLVARLSSPPLDNVNENKKDLKEIIPKTLHRFPRVSVKNAEQFPVPLYGNLNPIQNRQKSAETKDKNSGSTDPGRSLLLEDVDHKPFSGKKGATLIRLKSLDIESETSEKQVSYGEDIYHILKKLRSSLGWKTELPKRNRQRKAVVSAVNGTGFASEENSPGKSDDGSFVYCLPRNRHQLSGRYNPYDLEEVPASSVGQSQPFWTASATNVTMYQCDNEGNSVCVATPALWWLWERRIFNMVHNMNFFVKFLFEKYFQLWKQKLGYKKFNSRSLQLQTRLFCVNDVLLRCLVHVNRLCEKARPSSPFADTSSSSGVLCLIELTNTICTLDDFAQRVKCQSKKCLDKFKSLQANIVSTVHQACSLVAGMEGIQWLSNPILENGKGKPPTKHFKMVYSKIASWRKVLAHLGRFLQCIDYIIATMLGRLVKDSVKYLMKHLEASYSVKANEIKKVKELRIQGRGDGESCNMAVKQNDFEGLDKKKTGIISRAEEPRNKKKTVLTADEVMEEIRKMTETYIFPVFSIDLKLGRIPSSGLEIAAAQKHISPQSEVGTPSTEMSSETLDVCSNPEKPKSRGRRSGFFLQLVPSSGDFFKCIEDILEGFENIISEFVPMKQEETLSAFYNPTFGDAHQFDVAKHLQATEDEDPQISDQFPWPYLDHLLWEDEEYQFILAKIRNFFKVQLKDIETYVLDFTRYRRMVENCLSVDRVIFGSDMDFNPEKFSHILASQTEMLQVMNDMIVSQRFGMMQICSSEFYKSCIPYPTKVLNHVRSHIPDNAQKKNLTLLRKIKDNTSSLEHEPVSVEECVDHLLLINQINHELTDLELEFNEVNEFFSLIRLYEMEVNEESLALYFTLASSFQHMKSTLIASEATKEGKIEKFQEELDLLITQTGADVTALGMEIRDPKLLTLSKSKSLALKKLQDLENELRHESNTLKDYSSNGEHLASHQRELRRQESEEDQVEDSKYLIVRIFKDLTELERDLGLRKLVLEADKEWNKMVAEWMSIPFQDIDVDNLQKQMTRFTQTVYMLEKGLPPNELVPKLRESVLGFKQVMPVVLSLCNPSLKLRHWEQLEQIMGTRVDKDHSITLGILMEEKLFRFKDKIQEISSRASNEGTLETMLKKIINLWEMTNLKIIPHANSWIIVGVEDLLPLLEESQVTIATIRGSKYVGPIKATVEAWEKRLQTMLRTLDIWLICQRSWIYFEEIFGALDIQRQLPNEYRMFLKVDRKWRELMQCLRDDLNVPNAILRPGLHDTLQSCNMALDKIQKSLEDYLETKRLTFPRFFFLSNEELLDVLANCRDPIAIQRHLGKCFGNIHCLGIVFGERPPDNIVSMTSVEGETVSLSRVIKIFGPVEQWLGNLEAIMFETVKRSLHLGLKDYSHIPLVDWLPKYPGQVILTVSQIIFSRSVQSAFSSINPLPALSTVLTNIVESLNILARIASTTMSTHQTMSIEALLTISVHNRDIASSLIENGITSATDFQWTRQLRYEWLEPPGICQVEQSTFSFPYGYEYLGCSSRLVITPLTDRCYLTLTGAMQLNLGGSPSGPAGTGKSETVKDLAKVMGKQCVVFNCSEGLDYKMLSKFFSGLILSGSWCCFDEFNRIGVEVLSVVSQQLQTIKSAKDTHAVRFVFDGQELKLNPTCGFFITMNPTYAGRVELPDNLKALFRPVAMMVPDYALIAEIMLFSQGFENAKTLSQKIINLYQLASRQLSRQDHYDFGMRAIKSVLIMAGQARKQASRRAAAEGQVLSEKDESDILIYSLRDANQPKFLTEDLPLFENILTDLFPDITPDQVQSKSLEKAIRGALREFGLQMCEKQVTKIKQLYNQILVRDGVMLVGPADGGKTTVRSVLHRALDIIQTNIFQALGKKGKKNLLEAVNINPKCVTLQALYGWTDPETFEWTDGLLASTIRNFAASFPVKAKGYATQDGQEHLRQNSSLDPGSDESDQTKWKWLILDGPVDTLWVENLNTVLDDSRVLCLANGERVNIGSGMRFLFEVDSLSQASPATISRCAMIYMDPVDLGWKPFVTSWFQRLDSQFPEKGRQYLQKLFEASVDPALKFLRTNHRHIWHEASQLRTVVSLCNILFSLLEHVANNGGFGNEEKEDEIEAPPLKGTESKLTPQTLGVSPGSSAKYSDSTIDKTFLQKNPKSLTDVLGKLFVFAFTWSFGNVFKRFEDDDQPEDHSCLATEFDALVRDLFENSELGIRLPKGDQNIYKYFLDFNSNEFTPWVSLVHSTDVEIEKRGLQTLHLGEPHQNHLRGAMDHQLVLTEEFLGFSFVVTLLLLNGQPVLLTGDAGSGKSILIKYILSELEKGVNKSDEKSILGRIFAYKKERGLFNQHENLSFLLTSDVQSDLGTLYDDDDDDDDESSSKTREPEMIISETCCSAQMTAARLQENLCSKLINRGGNSLGALKGKKVVVFVDDLNMPSADEFGAHPPLELLRQVVERRGFYESKSLAWKSISDVTLVTAAGPPGGGRSVLSSRLLKHFCILGLPEPSSQSLQYIYQVELGSFFKQGSFMPEVLTLRLPLVSACIQLYHLISTSLKPTPRKSHYVFNLRDISKVVQGLLQAEDRIVINRNVCLQLFVHEAMRVFHDRLVDAEDKAMFFNHLTQTIQDNFKRNWTLSTKDFVIFGDFFEENPTKKIYRPISDQEKLIQILENYRLKMTLGSERAMQIVFFKEAVQHIMRATRVLRQKGGHLLMVGYDGSGKSLVCKFATFISGHKLYRLQLHRSYGTEELHEDLKKVFQQCGVQGIKTVLVISDQDIVKESFLEDINSILNSGEVPGLFDADELEGLLMSLKPLANETNVAETKQGLYNFFIQRVQRNLHVVLSMNVRSGKFHQRCRVNPALINSCTIDWYDIWDREAMLNVASAFFSDSGMFEDEELELSSRLAMQKPKLVESCVQIYDSVLAMGDVYWSEMRSRVYFTPADYMEFVQLYSRLTCQSKNQHMDSRNRLQNGVQTIVDTNASVAEMKEDLVTLGPKIEEKAKETDNLLSVLTENQTDVEQVQQIVEEDERIMKMEAKIIQDYAQECTNDLESVLPELRNAQVALSHLDKASISEIRVYINPPQLVIEVMSAVCVLFQKEATWQNAKLMLADPNFLKQLIEFDKDSVTNRILAKLRTYTQKKEFNPRIVAHVSIACRSICQWLLVLEQYYAVIKMVKPKRKKLTAAEEALKMAEKRLASKQECLKKVQNHWRTIQEEYESKVNEREVLKKRKELIASRLKIAGLLIAALADEEDRWLEAIHSVNAKLVCLLGDNLIGSAAVCFAGSFTSKYRSVLVKKWKEICLNNNLQISENFDVIKNMVYDQQILNWNSQGLPRNSHSVENAILMTKNRKWPLFIDPEGQATKWIKQAEGQNLKVASAEDLSYMRTVERCLRMGDPLLLIDVGESLDPALRPILTMETFHQGGTKMIRLGETAIEYNDHFKFYLVSSLNKPHFLPPVGILVNIINFTVTVEALKEHLLSTLIMEEKPELEKQRITLLSSITKDKQMLTELEDKSLLLLQKNEKHILDDEDLVENLQMSRDTSQEIYRRVSESEESEKQNQTARTAYVSVATRGTVLYFTLVEMSQVDSMYQFSLGWFQDMFKECIHPPTKVESLGKFLSAMTMKAFKPAVKPKTEKKSLQTHLMEIINRLTSSVYRVVSRSLFARHQQIFSFLLCTNIMRMNWKLQEEEHIVPDEGTDIISEIEWQIFLQGNILAKMEQKANKQQSKQESSEESKSFPSWISDTTSLQCELISRTIPVFRSLCSSLVSNPNQWNSFRESHSPLLLMKEPLPPSAEDPSPTDSQVFPWEKLSSFQRLLLIKILCPESLTSSIKEFISHQMGDHYLSFGGFDLKDVYQESSCSIPLIFILSPGCDPAMKLLKFAKDLKGSHRHLDMVSLGRGQGSKAEELINRAQIQNGRWVFLQNCHLAASWMPQLQKILEKLNSIPTEQRDPNFRLWLSSKPDPCFPVQILQKGIKMIIESPSGLKAGMQRCFDASGSGTVTPEMFEDESMANGVGCDVWKKLLFGLCLFNNIIHERKKYGTLGWNIPYEFNDSDLQVSILHLHMLLSENKTVPWSALTYLTGEVNYGGRVTDDQDRLCLENILTTFFCPGALAPNYTHSPDGVYKTLPDGINFEEVVKLISTFPSKTSANLFGMSEDAQIACQQLRAQSLVDTLTSVQPAISSTFGGSKQSTDNMVLELCDEIQNKLPDTVETLGPVATKMATRFFKETTLKNFLQKNFHTNNAYITPDKITIMSKTIDEVLGNSPLVIQLQQELDTFDHLLELIHNTLIQLKLAINGEIIMSGQLEDIYHSILIQQVPARFKKASYESCQPLGEWVTDLFQRIQFFFHWSSRLMEEVEGRYTTQTKGSSGLAASQSSCYPGSYWLPAFSFPQGFLTAVLQTHARKLSMSIDLLEFGFELVLENISKSKNSNEIKRHMDICHTAFTNIKPPEEGVLIFGLYLDSAILDPETKLLQESPPRKRFCEMPHIHLKPKLRMCSKRDSAPSGTPEEHINMYNCPVYRTMDRSGSLTGAGLSTNYVMSILLPTDQPSRVWILRGTALLCQISDD